MKEVVCTPESYVEDANESSRYALPNSLVISQFRNVLEIWDRSRTVSEIEFQIIGPERAVGETGCNIYWAHSMGP